jgi:hypothetical protein
MITTQADHFRGRHAASPETGGGGGGHMDEVLRRLGLVESAVAEFRGEIRHLATKADLGLLRADLEEKLGRLTAQIASMEGRIIKWLVATLLSSVGAAAAVAKLLS